MSKAKNVNIKNAIDAKFLDANGKEVFLKDVITDDECWELGKDKKKILSHDAVKKLASIAGISKNYDVEESTHIVPSYNNELEHIVRVTIHCLAVPKNENQPNSCVHDYERTLTVTGEANRISTPNRGRGYLRKMAEKRAYDIAVLEHLGIYSSVYSEEESNDFRKEDVSSDLLPGTEEFENITDLINSVLNAKTNVELKKTSTLIKKMKLDLTDRQIEYLRKLFNKQYGVINPPKF